MIKIVDENLFRGVEPQLAIKIECYEKVVNQFQNPPHIGDDILPGLGVFEGYWGETPNGILVSTLKCVDETDPNPEYFDIYAHDYVNHEDIIKELSISKEDILWKKEKA